MSLSSPEEHPDAGTLLPFHSASRGLDALEARLRILTKVVEQSPVSILVTDSQGLIEYVNPKFCQLTGFSQEEVLGKTPRILKGGFLNREFYQDLWRTIKAGQEWHGVFHNRTKSGELLWELASISPIRDDQGVITHFVGVKEDITEFKRLQEQASHQASHDVLTGLPNRLLLYDRIKHLVGLAKRRRSGFALFYLDLDGFKAVNDQHGHEAGDRLLTQVAQRLLESVRGSDTVARVGGDEFVLVLADLEAPAAAAELAQQIQDGLSQPFQLGEISCSIGASLGISFYPGDGDSVDSLISAADAAMYAAKHAGSNCFRMAGRL